MALRLAELVAGLCTVSDLAKGLVDGQGLRSCVFAMRLADHVGLGAAERETLFWVGLLRFVGCTATASQMAAALGDEIAVSAAFAEADTGNTRDMLRRTVDLVGSRPLRVAGFVRRASGTIREHEVTSCEVAQSVAAGLGLPADVAEALGQVFERYDGRGHPGLARGTDLHPAVRTWQVAHTADLLLGLADPAAVATELRRRGGGALDPWMAETAAGLLHLRPERGSLADLLGSEPLRAAGAVVVGTTRMPELAAWAFTSSAAFGPTRNPLDPRLDPGGSSGGAAAAVASGMAAAAVGTDGGGSIRVPAAACGLVGLKPTRALVPLPGGTAEHWFGMTVAGPITRTAQDAAAFLAVLAGEPGLASCAVPGTVHVAYSVRSPSPLGRPGPHQRAAVDEASSRLGAAGHTVSAAAPPYPATMLNDWGSAWLAGIAQDAERLGLDESRLEPRTRTMVRKGRRVLRKGGPGARVLGRWTRRVTEWMTPYDVLLMPVTSRDPGPVGALDGKGYLRTYVASARSVPMTQAWNLAGFPAVAVPVGTREGKPLAVQLVGRAGSESLLLGLAAQLAEQLRRQL